MDDRKAMNVVDFIIVGSMKSGTTSLHQWLMRSEQISMLEVESHFFNHSDRFNMGLEEYRKRLPSLRYGCLTGDVTPTYSFLPEVPGRIHSMAPQVKLLWILRDPLQRAISQYWHVARKGFETKSIEEAFISELKGKTDNIWKCYLYRSCYKEQIERYLELFTSKQIHFVDFKAFITGDIGERNKVADFLEIQRLSSDIPHSNETGFFPRPEVNRIVSHTPLPPKFKKSLRKVFGYKKAYRPTLSDTTYAEAQEFLEKKNMGLERLIGFSL